MAKKKKGAKTTEIFFAGFGGQGIMFMGKVMTHAGLLAGRNVTWMPSYGAEVRGGTAYSMTKISDKEIASPVVTRPDILVAMNQPSLSKYEPMVKEGGIVIANKSLIQAITKRKGVTVMNIPFTDMASKLGNVRCANMIALGALLKKTKIFPLRTVASALKDMIGDKKGLLELNKRALEKGFASSR